MLCPFFLDFMNVGEKFAVIWIVFPLEVRCHFSLTAFKIFVFSFPKFDFWRFELLCIGVSFFWTSLVVQMVKNPLGTWETWVLSLGWEDPLEEGIAIQYFCLSKFLWVILSGVNSASGLCRFILLPNLRSFQLLSLWILLYSFLFFLSFQNSNCTDVRLFVTIPQILAAQFIFSLFSLCCSDNVIFTVLSMNF